MLIYQNQAHALVKRMPASQVPKTAEPCFHNLVKFAVYDLVCIFLSY